MKKGFDQGQHPTLIPAQYEMIYNVGMTGVTVDPMFLNRWKELPPDKRGVIHQPALSTIYDVNDNASAFLGLLNDLTYSGWNNGLPIMIDIWKATEGKYNLDNLRQHGIYITEHYKPKVKPILRVIHSLWSGWVKNSPTEAFRLLNDFDLLLAQTSMLKPTPLESYGMPVWWEYEFGKYVFDPVSQFEGVVKPFTPTPPPVEEPPVEEPTPPVSVSFPKRWKVSLLGGLIKGTIEAIDE